MDGAESFSHELFPRGVDDDGNDKPLPVIEYLYIRRFNKANDPKDYVQAPERYTPSELTGWKKLHELCGGGIFQVVGLTKQHRYGAFSEVMTLPGPPKGFFATGVDMTQTSANVAAMPAPSPIDSNVLMLKAFMEIQSQERQNTQAMMLKMMEMTAGPKTAPEKTQLSQLADLVNLAKVFRSNGDEVKSTLALIREFQGMSAGQQSRDDDIEKLLTGLLGKAIEKPSAAPEPTKEKEKDDWVEVVLPHLGSVRITRAQHQALLAQQKFGNGAPNASKPVAAAPDAERPPTQTETSKKPSEKPTPTNEAAVDLGPSLKEALNSPDIKSMIPEGLLGLLGGMKREN